MEYAILIVIALNIKNYQPNCINPPTAHCELPPKSVSSPALSWEKTLFVLQIGRLSQSPQFRCVLCATFGELATEDVTLCHPRLGQLQWDQECHPPPTH